MLIVACCAGTHELVEIAIGVVSNSLLNELVVYLQLAQAFKDRLQLPDRDRALVLAGSAASLLKFEPIANFCRALILNNNAGHMVKRWGTFREALQDDDFHVFLKQLTRRFPTEVAESLLRDFGFQCDVRRSDYENELDFVAAIMGVDAQWVEEHFA